MNILYGIQATGQGHISRARALARAFSAHPGVSVTWLFSGRERERLFDMEVFGEYLWRRGLTFSTARGRVNRLRTITTNNLPRLLCEVTTLDVSGYDLVVSDFEPVTAWAARRAGKRAIGIGHQYAFGDGTPIEGDSWVSRLVMRWFAPVDVPVGLHWQPYRGAIAPPILDLPLDRVARDAYFLVYLPFEEQLAVTELLRHFPEYHFVQYAPGLAPGSGGNVQRYPAGKPVLTKPLAGQVEQLSNARALREAALATTMSSLDRTALAAWLADPPSPGGQQYPDVAAVLADWLAGGARGGVEPLCRTLWSRQSAHPAGARDLPGTGAPPPRLRVVACGR